MLPPWKQYPELPHGRLGWRMGYGEEYYNQFYMWFSRLDTEAQTNYAANNPEPDDWAGIYERIKSHPWL